MDDKCENPTLNKLLKQYDRFCAEELEVFDEQLKMAGKKYEDLTKSEKRKSKKLEKRVQEIQSKRGRIEAKIKTERYRMLGSGKDFVEDLKTFDEACMTAMQKLQLENKRPKLRPLPKCQRDELAKRYFKLIPNWLRFRQEPWMMDPHPRYNMFILAEACELYEKGVIPLIPE